MKRPPNNTPHRRILLAMIVAFSSITTINLASKPLFSAQPQQAVSIPVPNISTDGEGNVVHKDPDPHHLIEHATTESMAQAEIAKYGKP